MTIWSANFATIWNSKRARNTKRARERKDTRNVGLEKSRAALAGREICAAHVPAQSGFRFGGARFAGARDRREHGAVQCRVRGADRALSVRAAGPDLGAGGG